MSVSNTASRIVYASDGSNAYWPYTFPIVSTSDLLVFLRDLDGELAQLDPSVFTIDTLNTRIIYPTVASGNPPLEEGQNVVVMRFTPLTQPLRIRALGVTSLASFESAYDRLCYEIQQVYNLARRAVLFPVDETPTPDEQVEAYTAAAESAAEALASAAAAAAAAAAAVISAAAAAASAAGAALSSTKLNRIYTTVGSVTGCDYATLAAALAAVPAGTHLYVVSSEALAAALTISTANISIEFGPGVSLTEAGSTNGLIINSSGCRIKGGRFSGFTTAIQINNTRNKNFISECRFSGCTTDIDDLNTAPNNVILANITE